MSKEMKELKIGDVIYHETRFYGMCRTAIDRVTKTRAFAGNQGFDKDYYEGSSLDTYPRQRGFSMQSFWIQTDTLDAKYQIQGHIRVLKEVKWQEHNIETLIEVRKVIGE